MGNQNNDTITAINQAIASHDFSSILFISKQLDLLLISDALRQPNGYPAQDSREVKFTSRHFPFGIALTHYYFASKELVGEIRATLIKVQSKVHQRDFRLAYSLYEVAQSWSTAFEGWVADNEKRIALAGTQQSLTLSGSSQDCVGEEFDGKEATLVEVWSSGKHDGQIGLFG